MRTRGPKKAGAAAAAERTRKRFARRQWRRRWLSWRYVVVAVLVLALVGTGVYGVWFSAWLDVEEVRVTGVESISADEIRERSGVESGTPLARVDLDSAEAKVGALAEVRRVDVSRSWPDAVVIEIEERVAIAVVELGGRLRGMDEEGVVFGSYKRAPSNLPRVHTKVSTSAAALREGAQVVSAMPESLSLLVDYVEVASIDEISLVLKDGRRAVWGSADDSALKARVLGDLLSTTEAQVYDVSVPSRPATRP